ncbi:hypothetical protein D3C85_893600 [compost metagenome]
MHAVGQFGQGAGLRADDLGQLVAADFQVVLQAQFLGHHQVVARLRFIRIRDGGIAQLEVAPGRFELPGHGGLLGLGGGQRVLGVQHVEVGVRHAQEQILEGLLELHFDVGDDKLGLLEILPAAPVEQGLGQRQIPDAAPAAVGVAQAAGAAGFLVGAAGLGGNQRQQQRAGLGLFFQAGPVVGAGGGIGRIVAQRGLPDLDEVLRGGVHGPGACGAGKNQ